MMFGQVVAGGDLAWAPNSRNFDHESIDEHALPDGDATQDNFDSPGSVDAREKRPAKGKNKNSFKRARSSTMDELAETSRIIGRCMMEPPPIQISSSLYTIPEAISEIENIPEVMDVARKDFYHYCLLFLRDKHNRETFMSMRKDRRVEWLESCFANKTN